MSAGVPTNPPVKPVGREILLAHSPVWVTLHVCVREREGAEEEQNVCVPTSEGSQQDLLVKGHGALACAAHHVSHCLIDGKSGEGIGHLRGEERREEKK